MLSDLVTMINKAIDLEGDMKVYYTNQGKEKEIMAIKTYSKPHPAHGGLIREARISANTERYSGSAKVYSLKKDEGK
jgi:hypothetical protein